MALYDPVDGVYRKVSKIYDPVDGVYRKVKAAYDPVDGVHRKYFSSDARWQKWSCREIETIGDEHVYHLEKTAVAWANRETTFYATRTKDPDAGCYYVSDPVTLVITDEETANEAIGLFDPIYVQAGGKVTGSCDELIAFHSIEPDYSSYPTMYQVFFEAIGSYYPKSYEYRKGNTCYGEITAPDGALPEDGTLIEGSANGSYCVLKIGSTYYYYVKEE